jgi:hypothetical protein
MLVQGEWRIDMQGEEYSVVTDAVDIYEKTGGQLMDKEQLRKTLAAFKDLYSSEQAEAVYEWILLIHPFYPARSWNLDALPISIDLPPCSVCGAGHVSLLAESRKVPGYYLIECYMGHVLSTSFCGIEATDALSPKKTKLFVGPREEIVLWHEPQYEAALKRLRDVGATP